MRQQALVQASLRIAQQHNNYEVKVKAVQVWIILFAKPILVR